jgi:hypothetical protein
MKPLLLLLSLAALPRKPLLGLQLPLLLPLIYAQKTTEEYLNDAKRFIVQGQHQEALQSLDEAVSKDSGNYLTLFKRAGNLWALIGSYSDKPWTNEASYGGSEQGVGDSA